MWIRTHPMLPSLDIDRTVHFYQDELGFAPTLWNDRTAVLVRDSVELHFWKCEDPHLPAGTACRVQVTDAGALYAYCREKGLIPREVELETTPWGKVFPLTDPDGNQLWIFEGEPPWSVPDEPRNSA